MNRGMLLWCGGVIVFGGVLAAGAFAPTDAPAMALLRLFGGHPPLLTTELRFAVGLMGAVSLGWGATLMAVAATTPAIAPEVVDALWRRVTWAVVAWFVVDSAISVATGFWPNAVSNAVLLGWFWVVRRA